LKPYTSAKHQTKVLTYGLVLKEVNANSIVFLFDCFVELYFLKSMFLKFTNTIKVMFHKNLNMTQPLSLISNLQFQHIFAFLSSPYNAVWSICTRRYSKIHSMLYRWA